MVGEENNSEICKITIAIVIPPWYHKVTTRVVKGENMVRASKTIKKIMIDKGVNIKQLAELSGKSHSTMYNTFYNDEKSKGSGMSFENVVDLVNALGCDVIIRDRETGEEY